MFSIIYSSPKLSPRHSKLPLTLWCEDIIFLCFISVSHYDAHINTFIQKNNHSECIVFLCYKNHKLITEIFHGQMRLWLSIFCNQTTSDGLIIINLGPLKPCSINLNFQRRTQWSFLMRVWIFKQKPYRARFKHNFYQKSLHKKYFSSYRCMVV